MPARWILCGQADEYSDDDEKMRGRGKEEEDRGALPNGHELGRTRSSRAGCRGQCVEGRAGHRTWYCRACGVTMYEPAVRAELALTSDAVPVGVQAVVVGAGDGHRVPDIGAVQVGTR
jgi:hypothetical protein